MAAFQNDFMKLIVMDIKKHVFFFLRIPPLITDYMKSSHLPVAAQLVRIFTKTHVASKLRKKGKI